MPLDQRLAGGNRSLVFVFGALDTPFTENSGITADHDEAIVEAGVFNDLAWKDSLFVCRSKDERRKRRSRRATGHRRTVIFAVLEISSTDHRQNASRGVLQGQRSSLEILRLRHLYEQVPTIEFFFNRLDRLAVCFEGDMSIVGTAFHFRKRLADGLLGGSLELRVKCGMDAETTVHHAPIAQGSHRLLANIVDRVRHLERIGSLHHVEGQAACSLYSAPERKPCSFIRLSTKLRARVAPSLLFQGDNSCGLLSKPAKHRALTDW